MQITAVAVAATTADRRHPQDAAVIHIAVTETMMWRHAIEIDRVIARAIAIGMTVDDPTIATIIVNGATITTIPAAAAAIAIGQHGHAVPPVPVRRHIAVVRGTMSRAVRRDLHADLTADPRLATLLTLVRLRPPSHTATTFAFCAPAAVQHRSCPHPVRHHLPEMRTTSNNSGANTLTASTAIPTKWWPLQWTTLATLTRNKSTRRCKSGWFDIWRVRAKFIRRPSHRHLIRCSLTTAPSWKHSSGYRDSQPMRRRNHSGPPRPPSLHSSVNFRQRRHRSQCLANGVAARSSRRALWPSRRLSTRRIRPTKMMRGPCICRK